MRNISFCCVCKKHKNICGRILTQFTGLLRTNTVAAKRDLLAERTGLGKSVSVSLRKGPNPFRRANLLYRLPHSLFVARKMVKYRVLTLFRAKFVVGAPVTKPKQSKCRHHDGDTSRYQENQFRYRSVRKCPSTRPRDRVQNGETPRFKR